MRQPLYIANWKMHKTDFEARAYTRELLDGLGNPPAAEIAIAPPFTALKSVGEMLAGADVGLAAQDLHWEATGAFTGEISGRMLADLSVRYVLVGHSERRTLFGESDDRVARKVKAALDAGLVPVVCIGENEAQRKAGRTEPVVEAQLRRSLGEIARPAEARFVIAYEPVWAIGTGLTATPEQVETVHRFLRSLVEDVAGAEAGAAARLLYGGSVTAESVAPLAAEEQVDGCLVGGASLSAGAFLQLVRAGSEAARPQR